MLRNDHNLVLDSDSYKYTHYFQTPPGTSSANLYGEARSIKNHPKTMFFGIQGALKRYFVGDVITKEDIDEAEEILNLHISRHSILAFRQLLEHHGGILPIEISAVPEGTLVDNQNVLIQVRETSPDAWWLPGFLETQLLPAIWYPSTVATLSYYILQDIKKYLEETADNLDGLLFKLHDFGARATTSFWHRCIGGLAHLVNFRGTDTTAALLAGKRYYNSPCAGFSIPAMEHFTVTSWTKPKELQAYDNMLDQFAKPQETLAIVADSYDLDNAIQNLLGTELKQKIIESGATLVVRPDSGHPVETPVRVVEMLMDKFGYRYNTKGYKILNHVRVIQGDGISHKEAILIMEMMKNKGMSIDNISFGMGGGLLQKVDRDTEGFTMKCNEVKINDQRYDVFKEAPGKKSKKGRLALIKVDGKFQTIREDELNGRRNYLRPIFRNGKLLVDEDLEIIRQRAA
jgi:nicotinamide phosphoribosyltransferase